MADRNSISFKVGELYSNDTIRNALKVGNAGGVRVNSSKIGDVRRVVLMTSLPSVRQVKENPYHDRIEGDTLVYTGAGREGDQSLAGQNKRLSLQLEDEFPIYGFQLIASRRDARVGKNRWLFLGLLEYLRHYPETQLDSRGERRSAWVFEFRIHSAPSTVFPDQDFEINVPLMAASRADRDSREEAILASSEEIGGTDESTASPEELEAIRRGLLGLSPERFEHFVKDLLVATGHRNVIVTKLSGDGGVDVSASAGVSMWAFDGMLIQVQAKRWLHTVGRREIAELRGSLDPNARGTLVTTSHFSKAAMAESKSPGRLSIGLVDGYSLAEIVIRSQLGLES